MLLRSDKGGSNFSDRSLLKNLGHWLGMLSLAKNKPIMQLVSQRVTLHNIFPLFELWKIMTMEKLRLCHLDAGLCWIRTKILHSPRKVLPKSFRTALVLEISIRVPYNWSLGLYSTFQFFISASTANWRMNDGIIPNVPSLTLQLLELCTPDCLPNIYFPNELLAPTSSKFVHNLLVDNPTKYTFHWQRSDDEIIIV